VYITAVFEKRKFEGFGKCDNSLEDSGGNRFSDKLSVIKVFLIFSSGGMKNLSVSVTLYRTVAVTNSAIWLIITSDRIDNWFWKGAERSDCVSVLLLYFLGDILLIFDWFNKEIGVESRS
jgi:hypothetical protein